MNRLMLLGFLLATATAYSSGTLQLGEPTVENDRITVPVLLGGDLSGGVSALDFRFKYNPEALQPVSVMPGTAAEGADKRVMSNLQTPGEYAVVMMGFNQTACGPGEAIRIVFQKLHGEGQDWNLSLGDATMSSVDGHLIDSRVLPSSIEAEQPDTEPEPAEAPRQRPGPSETRQPASADGTSGVAASGTVTPGVAYGGMVQAAGGAGMRDASAAERLDVAMKSAGEARKLLDTLADEVAGAAEAAEAGGEPAGTTGISAAGEIGPRTDRTGVVEPGTSASAQWLSDITVERQSGANTVQTPLEPAEPGGQRVFYGVVAFVVIALAAASVLRRSRLIG